jgi:hypothetical protein
VAPAQAAPLGSGQALITGDVICDRVIDTAERDARAGELREVPMSTGGSAGYFVRGVPLHEVLAGMSPRPDTRHKMAQLNAVVLAISEDGYQVVLSLAELEPESGASAALLATRYNVELVVRPTLVMPCDARASRYVRGLCRLCRERRPVGGHARAGAPRCSEHAPVTPPAHGTGGYGLSWSAAMPARAKSRTRSTRASSSVVDGAACGVCASRAA